MARIEIGKHLAAESRICGGPLIFKDSRILVSDALELTQAGYSPQAFARQYRGMLTPKAVREVLVLTRLAPWSRYLFTSEGESHGGFISVVGE
ncbi:MAG: DUF433 domain-containing protein [Deltaproteobacteria bacterium]|nr:DUF433 domain-containing protein [Deltaproteobacteria bacterium]